MICYCNGKSLKYFWGNQMFMYRPTMSYSLRHWCVFIKYICHDCVHCDLNGFVDFCLLYNTSTCDTNNAMC